MVYRRTFEEWESSLLKDLNDEERANLLKLREEADTLTLAPVCLPSHLRFLHARKTLDDSLLMINKHYAWRQAKDVATLKRVGLPDSLMARYKEFRKVVPCGYCGQDRENRPIYVSRIGSSDPVEALKLLTTNEYLTTVAYESERMVSQYLLTASNYAGRVITNTCTIIDLAGFSMGTHFNNSLKELGQCLNAETSNNYPETVGTMFFVCVPRVFNIVWMFLKSVIDQNTRNKVTVLKSNELHKLQTFIDPLELPEFLGGSLKWDPTVDPDLALKGMTYAAVDQEMAKRQQLEDNPQVETPTQDDGSSIPTGLSTSKYGIVMLKLLRLEFVDKPRTSFFYLEAFLDSLSGKRSNCVARTARISTIGAAGPMKLTETLKFPFVRSEKPQVALYLMRMRRNLCFSYVEVGWGSIPFGQTTTSGRLPLMHAETLVGHIEYTLLLGSVNY